MSVCNRVQMGTETPEGRLFGGLHSADCLSGVSIFLSISTTVSGEVRNPRGRKGRDVHPDSYRGCRNYLTTSRCQVTRMPPERCCFGGKTSLLEPV